MIHNSAERTPDSTRTASAASRLISIRTLQGWGFVPYRCCAGVARADYLDAGRRVVSITMVERQRVAHPRSLAHRVGPRRTVALELAEQTSIGEELLAAFLRQHLRLNALLVAVVGGLAALTLLFFIAAPNIASTRVGGMPLTWLILGVCSYPTFALIGWRYRKHSDAIDERFVQSVRHQ